MHFLWLKSLVWLKIYVRTIIKMGTNPALWLDRDKEEISSLMKLFLCPLPLWKIEAREFHYELVCFSSRPSWVRDSKAISVRSQPWSSHLHTSLQLLLQCSYLKSVFTVISPLAFADSNIYTISLKTFILLLLNLLCLSSKLHTLI